MNTINRPDWDCYFMTMACVAAMRSPDPATKHGSVIVDNQHKILGIGYNCFPRGAKDDSKYPLTRPEKYAYMIHSERNALDNCSVDTNGATVYVTGMPCSSCLRDMIQTGIKKVIYGQINSACVDDKDQQTSQLMLDNHNIKLIEYKGEEPDQLLEDTIRYLKSKLWYWSCWPSD